MAFARWLRLFRWSLWLIVPTGLVASEHWAYQPISDPPVPQINAENPIDAFINQRLRAAGLSAGAPTPPRTLIRRATWDLTGLPPTPDAVQRFLEQSDYPSLLENLLDSPRYGERWGRHWLDLVRYADTAGDAADFPVPEAYQYRNYVIQSFQEDKPYDQFIREQLAGDLLASQNDAQRWNQIVATGYLAISRRIGVSPHQLEHITIEDTIDNLGKTFLGLTIGCARCHDHKFDAIPTTDYYALYGFFESSVYPHAGAEHKPWRENFSYRIGNEQSLAILAPHRQSLQDWRKRERAQLDVYRSFQTRLVTDKNLTRENTWNELLRVRAELTKVAERFPPMDIAYAIRDGDPVDSRVQKAGSPASRDAGDVVRRGFLQLLGGQQLPNGVNGSGRDYLANWIASPDNPLTARVMVNRIWAHHFGNGLVATPSDFGVRGEVPTHPLLLEFLASRFIESGWSIKEMHRRIMTSQAYLRASTDVADNAKTDPDNALLWRMNRQRLDAEQLRDGVKFLAGSLDLTPGGRHPFPHYLTYFYRQHEPFQEVYQSDKRSVYLMQQRLQKNPYMELFDGPDGNTPLENRGDSTTSTQALYFMNSEFAHHEANILARKLLNHTDDTTARIQQAYAIIFGRPPSDQEEKRGFHFFSEVIADLGQPDATAWSGYIRSMFSSNEFLYID